MEENEYDDVEKENVPVFKPWHVLFVVDTGSSMFTQDANGKIPFQDCISALWHCADTSLILTPLSMKSRFGVILAENDVEKAKFIDYSRNMPENVKFLDNLKRKSPEELANMYKRKGKFDLSLFLHLCKHELDQLKTEAFKKTIVYITNDSDPSDEDTKIKEQVLRIVEELKEQGVYLKIVTTNPEFDSELFYKGIFNKLDFDPISYVECSDDLQELLVTYIQIKVQKFSSKLYPFMGNDKKYLKLKLLRFVRLADIKNNVKMTKKDHTLVKKRSFSETTKGASMIVTNPADKTKSAQIAIKSEDKCKLLETSLPVGLTLLYTCPKISRHGWLLRPISIVQNDPSETLPHFLYLWRSLSASNLVMVCYYKASLTGKLYFVELEPKNINQTESFILKVLPTCEDIKGYNKIEVTDLSEQHAEAMSSIVDKLTFDFHEKMFCNPVYKMKEEYIKSQLLEENVQVKKDDEPNEIEKIREKIDKEIKDEVQTLEELIVKKKAPKRKMK